MWSINISVVEGRVRVRANRWQSRGPYPTQLLDFELLTSQGESELALLERVGMALRSEALRRRSYR